MIAGISDCGSQLAVGQTGAQRTTERCDVPHNALRRRGIDKRRPIADSSPPHAVPIGRHKRALPINHHNRNRQRLRNVARPHGEPLGSNSSTAFAAHITTHFVAHGWLTQTAQCANECSVRVDFVVEECHPPSFAGNESMEGVVDGGLHWRGKPYDVDDGHQRTDACGATDALIDTGGGPWEIEVHDGGDTGE